MSALFGYGNVAGLLFHKGVMSAPPQPDEASSSSSSSNAQAGPSTSEDTSALPVSSQPINPITGTTVFPKADGPEMTDEEKERELEKLLVLFDRMEKIGALPKDQNPIRKAIHEGKIPS